MLYPRSFTVCAMAVAFVVVFCAEPPQPCPEANHLQCNKECPRLYRWVGTCPTYWCCSDSAQLVCGCKGIEQLGSCTNDNPQSCKLCCEKYAEITDKGVKLPGVKLP